MCTMCRVGAQKYREVSISVIREIAIGPDCRTTDPNLDWGVTATESEHPSVTAECNGYRRRAPSVTVKLLSVTAVMDVTDVTTAESEHPV